MRQLPTVARIMHYFCAPHDTFMTRRMGTRPADHDQLPLAALVVDVVSDKLVNVTVFDAFGKPHSRVHVPVVDEENPYSVERCREGWVAWPVLTRAGNTGQQLGVEKALLQARGVQGNPGIVRGNTPSGDGQEGGAGGL
jgi:hypothetical protein